MDTEKLINEVYKRPPLWDRNDNRHRVRYVSDGMWEEVAQEMNTSREAIKSRWKSLRDRFVREWKLLQRRHSSDGLSNLSNIKCKWPHFTRMLFLRDHVLLRPSNETSYFVLDEFIETDEHCVNGAVDDFSSQGTPAPLKLYESDTLNEISSSPSIINASDKVSETEETVVSMKRKPKRSRIEYLGNALVEIEKQKLKASEEERKKALDEDANFFNSLIPHLKGLSPDQKLLLHIKVQELIYDFVYKRTSMTTSDS